MNCHIFLVFFFLYKKNPTQQQQNNNKKKKQRRNIINFSVAKFTQRVLKINIYRNIYGVF